MSRIIEDDRITYIYLKLIDTKQKKFIEELIQKLGIASISTARRRFKEMDKWSNSDKSLFLATYIPAKSDSKAVDEVLGVKADKVSKQVEREPVSENKKELKEGFEEKIEVIFNKKVYGFIYTGERRVDECNLCDLCNGKEKCICEVEIGTTFMGYFKYLKEYNIEELSAKNEKLQEELRKYKNDLNSALDDRQKLECLLHDSIHNNDESKEFRDIIEKMIQLYTAKNKDYGNAFSQSYNEFGAVMSIIRINDKLNRFKTLVKQNSEVKTESVTDTLIDLANYAVMTIMEINNDSKST